MGKFEFKLPDIGEGVVEGEIVEWMVAVGDTVKEDDPILSVMTDKATVEIPAPCDGTVSSIVGEAATSFPSVAFASFLTSRATATPAKPPNPWRRRHLLSRKHPLRSWKRRHPSRLRPHPLRHRLHRHPLPVLRERRRWLRPPFASEPEPPTSTSNSSLVPDPAGRISHADLDRHIAGGAAAATPTMPVGGSPKVVRNGTEDIKVIGLRRKIADGMMASYSTIPHFSYFEEVDVTELEALRQHLNATRPEGAPKLTYLPFIMQALVKALAQRPECNAVYDDEAGVVTRHEAINLGIATQTDRGLYVPVVKHVEAMDVWQSAAEMMRVTQATREGKAGVDDLTGSTFTITSLGRLGGLGATPIINKPEVGILGVHNAKDRAVVHNGHVVVRRIMNLSSSWDHRVVDGHDGASLVQLVKSYLEHPATIFM